MTIPRRRPPGLVAIATAAAVLVLASCSGASDAPTPDPTPGRSSASSSASAQSGQVQKLVTFIVENKTFEQMRTQMPWTTGIAEKYGYTTDYHALTHPSLPNYLAIAGGSLFGVADDDPPSAHPVSGPSIFGSALDAGSTATLYADAMHGTCELEPDGRYGVKHNPWAYFVDERAACAQHDVPLDQLSADIRAGALPAVGMVIPDLCNDAHDCPLSVADAWLERVAGEMMTGPDWRSGHLAIVITADEDDRTGDNKILTVVAHPGLDHAVVSAPLDHYSLGRSYAEVGGFDPLRASRTATSLLTAFGLHG
ncbi:alkaline phosphatase family protein [Nocardioides mangrovi]|uniref:Alkaline phosphatase family protein n=1 Tax=Nocardioides mangrovi TaxID=2874580 RepID=A0ABS7U8L8_9ACTN|nr:alkaline phosphatase family protein [Nocardioides mangrovi]MBZ5737177.1 alkaline phosphatase family protein [Nocardioides mangrovi]